LNFAVNGLSCHSRANGNPVFSMPSGFPLPDQVEDKLRGNDRVGAFLKVSFFVPLQLCACKNSILPN